MTGPGPTTLGPATAAAAPRRRRRSDTVAGRTVFVAVAAALITAFVTLAVSLVLIQNSVADQARTTLSNFADITAATLEDPRPGPIARLQTLLASQSAQAFLVLPGVALPDGIPAAAVAPLLSGDSVSTTLQFEGQHYFVEGRPVGAGGVVLVASADIVSDSVGRNSRRLLLALVVGLVAAVGVALLAARPVTAPMRRVAEGADRLAAGQRDVRVDPDGPAEVAEIADAVNRLSAALQVSEGRQREFLLSVSHELRTPLTAVAGYAEALADGIVEGDAVPQTGEVMLAESRRLERLVADLLDLSRLGAADLRIERRSADLRALLESAAAVWRDRCEREGLGLVTDIPAHPVPVVTDPDRVRQIIDNLAENALRVTPVGGVIVLALRAGPGTAGIEVRDSGPGLSPQDVLDAFEPGVLYTRYRGVRPVSSGVGLALVGRLATRLGGTASAGLAPEGGAAFTVVLPLAPPTG